MSKVTVIILASGAGKRWGQATNKVLVDVNGEPLICRTQRMAKKIFGVNPITVTRHMDVANAVGQGNYLYIDETEWTTETLYRSSKIWRGRVIVLLGDTYYTVQTLSLIRNTTLPIAYFGRLLEIYAMSFYDLVGVLRLAHTAIKHAEKVERPDYRPGRLWHTWYALNGYSLDEHTIPPDGCGNFVRLFDNDITMDIDFPADYAELLDKI